MKIKTILQLIETIKFLLYFIQKIYDLETFLQIDNI